MAIALRTPRLLLREWCDADIAPFLAMSAEPALSEHLPVGDDAWVDRVRSHWQAHGFGQFVVELPGEAPLIGVIGLAMLPDNYPCAPGVQVAWRLARPCWGRGFALEAARAALDDGFGRLHLDEIVALTLPANRRSWSVMERLGMTRDPADDFDHPRYPDGHPHRRHVLYRLRRPLPAASTAGG
jgi:ribosomal-protein-alanine N-acetyltransferase